MLRGNRAKPRKLGEPDFADPGDEKPLHQGIDPFRIVFREARDAMLICDDQRMFIEANPAACLLLEHSREELLGCPLEDFVETGQKPEVGLLWKRLLEQGEQRGKLRLA